MVVGWLVSGAFVLVWLLLLVHCIRRKGFYPVFGKATKAVWALSFLLFNPLLMLAYIVFGMIPRPVEPGVRPRRIRGVKAVAYLWIVVAILLVNTRAVGPPATPRAVTRAPNGSIETQSGRGILEFGAQSGMLMAETGQNVTTTSTHSDNERLSAGTVHIRCDDPHPLLDAVGRHLQVMLVTEVPVCETVVYYPFGEGPPSGIPLADVSVRLEMESMRIVPMPAGRRIHGVILWKAGTHVYRLPAYVSGPNSIPRVDFDMNGTLRHESRFHGIELGSARYHQAAADIAHQIANEMAKTFSKWAEEYGLMPDLPDALVGPYSPPPDIPILPADAEVVESGYGILRHTSTVWRFEKAGDDLEIFEAFHARLLEDGWRGRFPKESLPYSLRLDRGAESISVTRERVNPATHVGRPFVEIKETEPQAPPSPIYVHYERAFTREELDAAMDALLATEDVETLLTFEDFFLRGDQRDRLTAVLEKRGAANAHTLLALTELHMRSGDEDRAREEVRRARIAQLVGADVNRYQKKIEALAEDLGEPELADRELDAASCREMGFLEFSDVTFPATYERGLGEPLTLFKVDAEGKVSVLSFYVQRTTRPALKEGKYTYVCVDAGGGHGHSVSRSSGTGEIHLFHQEFDGDWVFAEVRRIENGRFTIELSDLETEKP